MNIPNWPFAILRFGVIGLIYLKAAPNYDLLYGQPLLYYGLPLTLLLATLGVHRYALLVLGTLLLCMTLTHLAPPEMKPDRLYWPVLSLVTFFLGFTPCDRDFSLRAWWNMNEREFLRFKADPKGVWNLYRTLVFTLYLSHLVKITSPNFFQGNYVGRALIEQFWGAEFLFGPWFPAICSFLAVMLWSLNLSFCVLVWTPRFYKQFLLMSLPFHTFLLIAVPGRDMLQLISILLLIPFAAYSLSLPKTSNVLTTT